MFLNTASTKHRKLRRLQSTGSGTGVVRRWVGGRGGSAYNLRQGHGLRGQRPDFSIFSHGFPIISSSFPTSHASMAATSWKSSPKPTALPEATMALHAHSTHTAKARAVRKPSRPWRILVDFWGYFWGTKSSKL